MTRGVSKSGSPTPRLMTSSIVAAMSKKRLIPDGGTTRTRSARTRSASGARASRSVVIVETGYGIESGAAPAPDPTGRASRERLAPRSTSRSGGDEDVCSLGGFASPWVRGDLSRLRGGLVGEPRRDRRENGPTADAEHLAAHHDENTEAHDGADHAELRAAVPEADPEPLD